MDGAAPVRVVVDDDGIAVVTLANPPLNLNTMATLHALVEWCARIAADESIRVVVITGAGDRAFCAGSDLKEFAAVRDRVAELKLALENRAFTAIEELPQPVIAALNGVTLGGGAEIALACDIRILDAGARFGFPEINLGVFPGSGGVFRLPRVVGPAHAYQLLYTGEAVGAEEALRIGLVNRIAPPGQCLATAMELARTLSRKPALALTLVRAAVRDSLRQSTSDATARTLSDSDTVFTGPDIDEGLAAFFAKRPAQFTAPRGAPGRRGTDPE
jgi:enoyl-CoA hydratase/carnithine racemase